MDNITPTAEALLQHKNITPTAEALLQHKNITPTAEALLQHKKQQPIKVVLNNVVARSFKAEVLIWKLNITKLQNQSYYTICLHSTEWYD